MEIGKCIRKFRKDKHLTQVQLSQLSGIKQATISAIENGRNQPTTPTLEMIAKALNCTLSEIMGEERQQKPVNNDAQEKELLEIFRQLTVEGQRLLLKNAMDYLDTPSLRKNVSISSMG